MRKKNNIAIISMFALCLTFFACQNQEQQFSDYTFSSAYFPYQSPVRTLILGDDVQVDTSNDNKGWFSIGVNIAGLYSNTIDRKVEYVIDTTMVDNVYNGISTGTPIKALPKHYYNYDEIKTGTITVPKGSLQGYVTIKLADAFFSDPLAITTNYVVPMRIVSAETDSILSGIAATTNANRLTASDWLAVPKNYTLYGIKYISPYAGNYLLRGIDYSTNTKAVVNNKVYHSKYIEQDIVTLVTTLSKNRVLYTPKLYRPTGAEITGLSLDLTFDNDGNCTGYTLIDSNTPKYFKLTELSAKFVKAGDSWGGRVRNTLTLSYKLSNSNIFLFGEAHTVNDTLVMRDRNVKLETFVPVYVK